MTAGAMIFPFDGNRGRRGVITLRLRDTVDVDNTSSKLENSRQSAYLRATPR